MTASQRGWMYTIENEIVQPFSRRENLDSHLIAV